MPESGKDRFDTLTDQELADHVDSGHVDPQAGLEELRRRRAEAAKPAKPSEHAKPSDTGK